ncbi:MAG TPA: electron transfer flavoprotein subunit alpha/FixB family protein [Candidatus Limnocylindrales bacterium]|nr:electron transfer flavoprotein subunit alpha/FixB family protein [Candidatus Limnocylindrales bacterium]
MSGPVLVFLEHVGPDLDRLSLEAVTFAASLAQSLGSNLEAVAIGGEGSAGLRLPRGVATLHLASDARLEPYAPATWAGVVGAAADAADPAAIVAPGSDRGDEVLAHLAARRGLPFAANVLSVTPGPSWRVVRQRWGGSLLEDAALDAPVRLLSVAPHGVSAAEPTVDAHPEVVAVTPDLDPSELVVRVVGHEPRESAGVSLTEARVVVGGGRGVGSAAGFAQLEELADLLHGAVGGSRVATSLGWRPHTDQIGQTGLRIAPDLYIACGISGAIQHIVGCKAAKRILAINTDPESPIMSVADYAVIGDLSTIVPAISAELRRRRDTAA